MDAVLDAVTMKFLWVPVIWTRAGQAHYGPVWLRCAPTSLALVLFNHPARWLYQLVYIRPRLRISKRATG